MNGRATPPPQRRVSKPAPVSAVRRPGRRRRRLSPLGRLIGIAVLVGVIGGGLWMGKKLTTIVKGGPSVWWKLYSNPAQFFPKKEKITVLLIGKDYEYDKNYQHYTGKASRADSIMLLSLDFKTKHVSALSVPRDTRVRIGGNTGKINATIREDTYPGIAGPKLLCSAVEEVTGVKPDYYLAIKPDAVGNLVKELGGVDVETLDAMEYHDNKANLHFKLPKGPVHITTANDAIGYCRYREIDPYERNPDGTGIPIGKINGNSTFKRKPKAELIALNKCLENGDSRRMARQQNMIRAMVTSGKKQFYRADQIVDTAFKQFETNLGRDQLLAIASLYKNTQPDQIASGTLAGEFEKHRPYYFIPDRRKTEALVQWLVNGDERAANRVTTVAVQNATKVSGAARRAAELLRDRGDFDATYIKEVSTKPITTTLIGFTKAVNLPRANAIATLLGGGTVQKDTNPGATGALSSKSDITVILGPDLAGKLGEQSALR